MVAKLLNKNIVRELWKRNCTKFTIVLWASSVSEMKGYLYCILTSGRLFELPYGEEKFTLSFARWLVKQNLEVIIIGSTFAGIKAKYLSKDEETENRKDNQKKIRAANLPYVIYMLSRLYLSLLYFFKILSINRKTPIRIIHAQDTGYSGLPAVIAGKILKIPVVLSSHIIRHRGLEPKLTGRIGKILLKFEYSIDIFTVRKADRIIAINPDIKNYYEKLVGKKIEFIPNTIKMKNFVFSSSDRSLIRKELGLDEPIKLIGCVARLSPEKNLITLINAVAKAIQDNPLIRLVIVGIGTQESQLRDEVRKHHLEDKVIFCVGVNNDIPRILSGLDIFVLPSYHEGISGALLEAMSCERAIICSNIPGNQVLVTHNKEGLLFNPHDSQELSDAIKLLSTDDSLRSRLGSNAKIKASEYDEDIVFPKILQFYSTLAKK